MKPASFEYHAPDTVAEACALLAEYGDEAKPLAGGQSLVPMLALRLARFEHLVDLNRISQLAGVDREDGTLVVRGATRQRVLERNTQVAETAPLLARATPLIGHFQIRNRGTVGGSLAHADPASEYPAVAVALGAELELASAAGTRRISAEEFFLGTWMTAARDDRKHRRGQKAESSKPSSKAHRDPLLGQIPPRFKSRSLSLNRATH